VALPQPALNGSTAKTLNTNAPLKVAARKAKASQHSTHQNANGGAAFFADAAVGFSQPDVTFTSWLAAWRARQASPARPVPWAPRQAGSQPEELPVLLPWAPLPARPSSAQQALRVLRAPRRP